MNELANKLDKYIARCGRHSITGWGLKVNANVPEGNIGECGCITPDGTPAFEWIPSFGSVVLVATEHDFCGAINSWYLFVPDKYSSTPRRFTWLYLHEPRFWPRAFLTVEHPPQWVCDELHKRLQEIP